MYRALHSEPRPGGSGFARHSGDNEVGVPQHISSDEIELYALRRVPVDRRRRIIQHLRSCAICRENVKKERSLRNTLIEAFRYLPDPRSARIRLQSAGWQVRTTVQQVSTQRQTFSPVVVGERRDTQPYTASAVISNSVRNVSEKPVAINARTRLPRSELGRFGLQVTARTESRNLVTIGR